MANTKLAQVRSYLSDTSSTNTLTVAGDGLSATTNSFAVVEGYHPRDAGKYYFEVTLSGVSSNCAFGVGPVGGIFNSNVGPKGAICVVSGGYIYSNTALQFNIGSTVSGTKIQFAVDLDRRLFWAKINTGNWNSSTIANPATGHGGLPLPRGYVVPFAQLASADTFSFNFGDTTFFGTVPTGFTSGWPETTAQDLQCYFGTDRQTGSSVVAGLNRGTLVIASTGNQTARATVGRSTGKWYFEGNPGSLVGANALVGIANSSAALTNYLGADVNGIGVRKDGFSLANAVATNILQTYGNGAVVAVAVDLDARLIWFRTPSNAGSFWNGSASADPATGVGGISLPSGMGSGVTVYPAVSVSLGSDRYGATFHTSIYQVPTGFSMWESAPANDNIIATQAGAEVVLVPPSSAVEVRATQLGVEVLTLSSPEMRMTQLAIEVAAAWASATEVSPDDFSKVVFLSGFNGASGAQSFTDEAKGRTITVGGAAQTSTTQLMFGTSALALNGTTDYLQIATSTDYDLWVARTSVFSIEAWIYPTTVTGTHTIVGRMGTFGNYGWRLDQSGAGLVWTFSPDGFTQNQVASVASGLTINTWQHVAVDRDSTGKIRLWINGKVVSTVTSWATNAGIATTGALVIGRDTSTTTPGNYFAGYIDELRICKGHTPFAMDPRYADYAFATQSAEWPRSGVVVTPTFFRRRQLLIAA